jgi:hypothetical protein
MEDIPLGLLNEPVIKKFWANKIESSNDEWGDYLLEIADIFSTFDGEEFDRELIKERFSTISGRSPYALRDYSNFRDEFGAYGNYLGLFRIERVDNYWKLFLSNAAKHFLCSTEPDVESFCRMQLSLFQYPNGAGGSQNPNGTVRIQSNIKKDTIREISNNIRINPLRLICKCFVALREFDNLDLSSIILTYRDIYMLMNDDRINNSFSPDMNVLVNVLHEYRDVRPPAWTNKMTNFKRNFHVLEWTGLFSQHKNGRATVGLKIATNDISKAYSYIVAISRMTHDFCDFETCYNSVNIVDNVERVISSSGWGKYFDALAMPMSMLSELSDGIDSTDVMLSDWPIGAIPPTGQSFPELIVFQSDRRRTFISSGKVTDPHETMVRREKANREHTRILARLATLLRLKSYSAYENVFIDLYVDANGQPFIFEVKSNNSKNVLSQIRKAIAQLYEYRYRSQIPSAILCIVLQQKPPQEWVIDYLLNDRKIMLCWLVDDVRLECPEQCRAVLSEIGILG